MPISTDLNITPYFDDYNPLKDYYRMLFKPGVSVQTRELNQLQTYIQTQIERFGDNIFQKGTIVEGCNFTFNNAQPYAKILDDEVDGVSSIPSLYVGKFAYNNTNLRAYIVNYSDGFEATSPDLKTIYFNYLNSGTSVNTSFFVPGEVLTISDPKESIYKISVENGGINFSNTDDVIIVSQVSVNTTTGVFAPGDYIIDTTPGALANLEIVSVDTTTLSSLGQVLLEIRPRLVDITNASSNSLLWTLSSGVSVKNDANSATGVIQKIFGQNATAKVVTSGAGTILGISIDTRGEGYTYVPYVTVKSQDNSTGINALDLRARNFIAQVQIAASSDSVGNGYIFGVSEGLVYQKGHFLRVNPQSIIVDKYSSVPNNVSVGFVTDEFIINSNIDTSLLDNALGTENYTAPGADRLKLVPRLQLTSKDEAAANTDFFTIVEWNDGNPYKQNQVSQYSRIGEEIARHTFDSSGSFVIDQFQVITESTANSSNEGSFYGIAVDPGQAYIGGQRVQTVSNYKIDVKKGIDTTTSNNVTNLNYGNYLRLREVGGNFLFKVGANVDFYDTNKTFLSNTALIIAGNTNPVGTKIGTAKIRSMILESDIPGTANSIYRAYLFDIQMNGGRNFREVRSIHFDGTSSSTANGVADVVLDIDSSTGRNIAQLKGTSQDGLIFSSGVQSIKNTNNAIYSYRTVDPIAEVANTGLLVKDLSSNTGEFFRDAGGLSTFALRELTVVPVAADLVQANDLPGTVSINTTSTSVAGAGINFFDVFSEGDFVRFSNGSANEIRRVISIANGTQLSVDSVFTIANTSATLRRVFPKNVPVPFGYRDGLTANVDVNRKVLTLRFGQSNGDIIQFSGSSSVNTSISYNVRREGVTSSLKTANRNKFVKIRVANNVGSTLGPWSLGVPDIFRLRNVYVANVSTVNTSSTNLIDSFYIDHNQNANFLGLGYLYVNPRSGVKLTSDDYILVEFDHFTKESAGYFDAVSYRRTAEANTIAINDSSALANLSNFAHSLEIPEVYTTDGQYYDLMNRLDFRPSVANTVTVGSDATTAPVNPSETESFDQTTDKKFPVPDGSCSFTVEHYLGRLDDVYISNKGNIYVLQGFPDVNPRKRFQSNHPKDSLRLQTIEVPPYPSVSEVRSEIITDILGTKMVNEKNLNLRLEVHTTKPILSSAIVQRTQPRVYTMEDIGGLERRIKDLEYYVSLTAMETGITNKIIPSSINPNINRFKFGFFADDFSSGLYSDTGNPQYSAAIESEGDVTFGPAISRRDTFADDKTENKQGTAQPSTLSNSQKSTNRITPAKHLWSLDHTDGMSITLDNVPYMDEPAIIQDYATVEPEPPVCIPIVVAPPTAQTSFGYFFSQQTFLQRQKIDAITFGTAPGTATLFFYAFGAFDTFDIFQGTGQNRIAVANSSQAIALTDADKIFLSASSDAANFYSGGLVKFNNPLQISGSQVKWAGKIQFTHNPQNGRDYTVVTTKNTGSTLWRYLLRYPTATAVPASTIVDVERCGLVNPPFSAYNGTMTIEAIKSSWSCSEAFRVNHTYYGAYLVKCTGLKPETEHKFFIDGVRWEAMSPTYSGVDPNTWPSSTQALNYIRSSLTAIGRPLISSKEGKLNFIVYVDFRRPIIIDVSIPGNGNEARFAENVRTTTYGSSGYSTIEVRDTNSVAKYITPDRTPNKILPFDARGTI